MTIDRHHLTQCVHAGVSPDPSTAAIMTPIFQTSTYVQQAPGQHKGWDYSRGGNPTRDALEHSLAALEKASYGLSFSSGLAAEQAVIQMLDPGDHVLVSDDVYGGTGRLFRQLFAKYQIEFEFVDMTKVESIKEFIKPNTKLIWAETPSNPLMKIIDIKALASLCHKEKRGITFVVDNTFASPIFQSPLEMGADIVMHSTTKYIGGHSDLVGGALMMNDQKLYENLKFIQFAAGAVSGPIECFLLLRSIKTLAIRMQQHHKNGLLVAEFLQQHPKVEDLLHPGLASHPQHLLARSQMTGYSGMLSFRLKGRMDDVTKFCQDLKLIELAESLGGVESLINHPETMTHASVPKAMREKLGINENLLRLSVGIESSEDLIGDLDQALSKM